MNSRCGGFDFNKYFVRSTEFEHRPQYILADGYHHPSIGRSFEFLDHVSADLIIFPEIGLNIDRVLGGIDSGQHFLKGGLPTYQQFQVVQVFGRFVKKVK